MPPTAIVARRGSDPAIRMALTPLRASVPQITIHVEKTQAGNLGVNVGDVYSTVQAYLGSSFVNQFMRFGHQYMVYAQADAPFRRETGSLAGYYMRAELRPDGAPRDGRAHREDPGPAVVTLYNLYPSATINGAANRGFSSGQAMQTMERIARETLPPGDDLRVDGDVVPGEARRQLDVLHLRPRDPARLLRPRRAVRELDHAGRRHPRRAARSARHRSARCSACTSRTISTSRSAWCC